MSIGPWQIVVIVLLILVLFGKGKISGLMGDFAQGIKAFKKGMQDDTAHASSGEDAKALAQAGQVQGQLDGDAPPHPQRLEEAVAELEAALAGKGRIQ